VNRELVSLSIFLGEYILTNGQNENIKDSDMLKELLAMQQVAVEFHGHSCPGLAIGVVASYIALKQAKRSIDEELVAVVENDACGIDGIQALTGCTFGKGNLIHQDYGKSVYTFYNRKTGKAIRLSLKPEIFNSKYEASKHRRELFDKVRNNIATAEELSEHNRLRQKRIEYILTKGSEIFNVKDVSFIPPDKARILDDIHCHRCKEPVMSARIVEKSGKKLCIPCSKLE
jgi:formylmethanofuran dehydrogenase subunit E